MSPWQVVCVGLVLVNLAMAARLWALSQRNRSLRETMHLTTARIKDLTEQVPFL